MEAAGRVRPVTLAGEQILPVLPPLQSLFPDGGLRRGSTVVIGATPNQRAAGTTSLTLAVAVAASQAGSWCGAVGLPALGMVAAAELGMALERFALVPRPGREWAAVTAALVDAVDLVLLRPVPGTRASDARRLMARARERRAVLVVSGAGWPEPADLSLSVVPAGTGWQGLGHGYGYLQGRWVEVTVTGRRAATRPQRAQLWLPGAGGGVVPRKVERQPLSDVVPAATATAAAAG